jgi:hypothetical protein
LTQATEEQNPKRHKTKASLVFSDTIPKDLATLSRRIVGINLHKHETTQRQRHQWIIHISY